MQIQSARNYSSLQGSRSQDPVVSKSPDSDFDTPIDDATLCGATAGFGNLLPGVGLLNAIHGVGNLIDGRYAAGAAGIAGTAINIAQIGLIARDAPLVASLAIGATGAFLSAYSAYQASSANSNP